MGHNGVVSSYTIFQAFYGLMGDQRTPRFFGMSQLGIRA